MSSTTPKITTIIFKDTTANYNYFTDKYYQYWEQQITVSRLPITDPLLVAEYYYYYYYNNNNWKTS